MSSEGCRPGCGRRRGRPGRRWSQPAWRPPRISAVGTGPSRRPRGARRPSSPRCSPPSGAVRPVEPGSEEPEKVRLDASELVVVHLDALDAPFSGKHPRLRLELQGDQDACNGAQRWPEPREIAGELLDTVDLCSPLDLHGDERPGVVATEQVNRPNVRWILSPHQSKVGAHHMATFGEQLLELLLHTVLDQTRIWPKLMRRVVQDLADGDGHGLAAAVGDPPDLFWLLPVLNLQSGLLHQCARGGH